MFLGHQVCTHLRRDFVPLLFADPLQVIKVLRLKFANSNLQLPPKNVYGIKVWRLARPLQDLKGIVHTKMKMMSSFTHPQVVPNLYACICSAEHRGRYSEECGKQSSSGAPLTSIGFFFLLWKSMVPQNSLVTNFLQNIFLCVWQNK